MNNKLFTACLFVLFFSGIASGQVQKDAERRLTEELFTTFRCFTDSLPNPKQEISATWDVLRDLTEEFQEGVFLFKKTVPDPDNPRSNSVYTYKVKLIATQIHIVSYELSQEKYRKTGDQWETYDSLISRFKDEVMYTNLKKAFRKLFQTDLNEQDLFLTGVVYGERCGITGTYSEARTKIIKNVKKEDKQELVKWLQSPNTEKQVYAVDGLYQLHSKGIKLSKKERKMIAFVMNKNGNLNVCYGCLYHTESVREAVKDFHF